MAKEVLDTVNVGKFTEEELKAQHEKIAQEKRSIMQDLNKIKYPLNVTVFTHGQSWSFRNKAFWDAMQKRDDEVLEFMETYLNEKK